MHCPPARRPRTAREREGDSKRESVVPVGRDLSSSFLVPPLHFTVAYQGASKLFALALKHNNPHAADFAGNLARSLSEKVRAAGHYVAHLKAVSLGDEQRAAKNAAIKAFDRVLPLETIDLQAAAAAEAVLPNHLLLGTKERELFVQSLAAGRGMVGSAEARRAMVLSKMNA